MLIMGFTVIAIVVSSFPLASVTCKVILKVPGVLKAMVCGPCVFAVVGIPPLNVQFQLVIVPMLLSLKVILSP